MGLTSSTSQQVPEGEHYNLLINPGKSKETDVKVPKIRSRARILKRMSADVLWNIFLGGSYESFALTQAEATSLISDTVGQGGSKGDIEPKMLSAEIKEYITLVEELSQGDLAKTVDFMSLLSSVLLFSDMPIEAKTDLLFEWIALEPGSSDFTFDAFFIAMKSFERGLSHAMGHAPCSEDFIRTVSTQWMALADPHHKGSIDNSTRVSNEHFFMFCTNRQHVVRRLLEALAAAPLQESSGGGVASDVTETVDALFSKGPSGGDEWMANPAWKKTAERMIPDLFKNAPNVKPASSLQLEWVHGYRGFDCRNNLAYVNRDGSQVAFSAAGLAVVQDNSDPTSRTQHYYGEHGDDVLCLAAYPRKDGSCLLASGEIGKKPCIYLYSWTPDPAAAAGTFSPLCCLSGYHTRGVSQLTFSADGNLLFSVGVEYTVAVYNCEAGSKGFGKMVASSQGPKNSKVLHSAGYGASAGSSAGFLTCGEKHAITWQLVKGALKQSECKLGAHRNNLILSAASIAGGLTVLGTSDGALVVVAAEKVCAAALKGSSGHDKSPITAMFSSPGGEVLVSADRKGKVIVWQVAPVTVKEGSTANLTACAEFIISGFNTSIAVEGGLNMSPGGAVSSAPSKASAGSAAKKGKKQATAPGKKKQPTPDEDSDDENSNSTPQVRAVCLSSDQLRLLVGTQTCEVLEFTLPNSCTFSTLDAAAVPADKIHADQLVCGHFKDEVWGLAVKPLTTEDEGGADREYCTVGDDGFLRVWSLAQHRQLCCVALPGMARTCDYSPDGRYLAVGFGGRVGRKSKGGIDGLVKIFRFDRSGDGNSDGKSASIALTQVGEIKDAKQWISCVRFSPDGCTLAVGSRDNSIYLYSVLQQYQRRGKFSKHNSGINQLDFTADGKYIQSNCSAYEILFSDANTGAQLTDGATRLMEEEWHSWTCTLGWPVIGIWSGTMDGSDVNAVHRSLSGRLIATSDDFGKVNVFRYPAVKEGGAEHVAYSGHSSHVTAVRWVSMGKDKHGIPTDDYLLSTGGEDKCVFQWRNSDSEADAKATGNSKPLSRQQDQQQLHASSSEEMDFAPPGGGDEFTAVKPWLGAIVAPTAWSTPDPSKVDPFYAALGEMCTQHRRLPDEAATGDASAVYEEVSRSAGNVLKKMYDSGVSNSSAPDSDELELEWVHGYRGFDCRNNIFYVEVKKELSGTGGILPSRSVVYYAAGLGVVLDPASRKQRYFRGHTDDIVSMAVHKDGSCDANADAIVATGQQGIGATFVWEVPSMRTLGVIKTKQKNVHMLEFSKDGHKLISVGEDCQIAVSDWASGTVLSITKGEPAATMHLAAGPCGGNLTFFTCGDKHMRMWTLNGRNLTAGKVVTSTCSGAKIQLYLCAAEVKGKFLVGCVDGAIYTIPAGGKGVKASFEHHTSEVKAKLPKKGGAAVTAMHVQGVGNEAATLLFTGAKNGTIVVWDASEMAEKDKPTKRYTLDVSSLGVDGLNALQIQAISMFSSPSYVSQNPDSPVVLVGTRGCDILEVKCDIENNRSALVVGKDQDKSAGVLMQAHCNDELWGVAAHPLKPEYCTVGDDKTLRFYSLHQRRVIATVPLGSMARAVAYNSTGTLIAVGFGGRVGRGKEKGGGELRLYTSDPTAKGGVRKLVAAKDAKEWISDVKFSADGHTLAVGAHDCKIYIYSVDFDGKTASIKLRSKFTKHNSVINHLDLSADGRFMQSNCSAYELLFCDTTTGRQITSATELRDVKWDSWTCTLGWPVQGIWAAGMDGSDINAVARSHSGHLLATSDDLGKVNLFRYPAEQSGVGSVSYAAHSSHVMNVRWTVGDECLLSCGGNDKCLMQWRHSMAGGAGGSAGVDDEDTAEDAEERSASLSTTSATASAGVAGGLFDLLSGPGGGDESGAVKPWLGAVRAPKVPPPVNPAAPNANLELQWVHGYTSAAAGSRNTKISSNLFYNADNMPVFPAAALAVQLNTKAGSSTSTHRGDDSAESKAHHKQTFFMGHDDDILCLAMSKDRRFIATGQTASKSSRGKGSIIVWDAAQCRLVCKMDGCHQRAVTSLAFSPDGSQLLSVGQDDSNTHILWEDKGGAWSKAVQLAICKGDKAPVLFSQWVHPSNPMAAKSEYHFLSGGAAGVNFWTLQGSTLTKKQGRFSKKFKSSPLLCGANLQGKDGWKMVVGTASGNLYMYGEREVSDATEGAHKGPVLCVAEGGEDCLFLVSGGRDKVIKVWNQALQPISVFDVSSYSCVDGSVASLDVRPVDSHSPEVLTLLVGTYGGEIMEVSSGRDGGSVAKKSGDVGDPRSLDLSHAQATVLLHSHYSGELWGLAPHPLDADIYATVGDDKTLRIWSIKRNCLLKAQPLYWPARSVCWHPSGAALAVGFFEATKGGRPRQASKKGGKRPAAKKGGKSTVPKNAAKRGSASADDDDEDDNPADGDGSDGEAKGDGVGDTSHKGAIHIYSVNIQANSSTVDVRKRADGCTSLAWINEIKFSPDGTLLVAGSHDKRLYAYSVPYERKESGSNSRKPVIDESEWGAWANCLDKPKYQFNKHSSAVLHVDFTADGKYFQTNCQASELLFGYPDTGKQETSATKVADYNCDLGEEDGLQWATQTCKLGWSVQGIWPHGSDTTDVNAVDRSSDHKLLATADDFGLVKLFRFPCVEERSKFRSFEGHSSHVTNVRWTASNQLLSVGGNDKCVFVWNMSQE